MARGYWGKRNRSKSVHYFTGQSLVTLCGRTFSKVEWRAVEWDYTLPETCPVCARYYRLLHYGLHRVEPEPSHTTDRDTV